MIMQSLLVCLPFCLRTSNLLANFYQLWRNRSLKDVFLECLLKPVTKQETGRVGRERDLSHSNR